MVRCVVRQQLIPGWRAMTFSIVDAARFKQRSIPQIQQNVGYNLILSSPSGAQPAGRVQRTILLASILDSASGQAAMASPACFSRFGVCPQLCRKSGLLANCVFCDIASERRGCMARGGSRSAGFTVWASRTESSSRSMVQRAGTTKSEHSPSQAGWRNGGGRNSSTR